MNKFFHSVYLQEDKCTGCITCLKRCPTGAIRVRNRKARIINEFCIDCGECIRHCPHHAKQTKQDHLNIINGFKYTVALPAPALYSQFNNVTDVNIILTAFLHMGFDDVFEVSAAAELITEATRDYVATHQEDWPLISTACPTIERLIRVRFPNLLSHLLPLLPPMELAAQLARERAMEKTGLPSEDIGIIFISPCPSKVSFIHSPLGIDKSNVDGALAIKDVYPILLSHMKETELDPKPLAMSGKLGKRWPVSGGEATSLGSNVYLAADGIENVIRVLEDLEDEKFPTGLQYVELNACNAGCVGGVLNVENAYLAKTKNFQISKDDPETRMSIADLPVDRDHSFKWNRTIKYEPVYRLGDNIFESMDMLKQIDALVAEFPGLDCGSCGAPTCRALAEDIIKQNGDACKEDCIYLMRDQFNRSKETLQEKEEQDDC